MRKSPRFCAPVDLVELFILQNVFSVGRLMISEAENQTPPVYVS